MMNVLQDHDNILLAVVPVLCEARTPLMSSWRDFERLCAETDAQLTERIVCTIVVICYYVVVPNRISHILHLGKCIRDLKEDPP